MYSNRYLILPLLVIGSFWLMSAYCCNPPIPYRLDKEGKEQALSPNTLYYELIKDSVEVRLYSGCQFNKKSTHIILWLYVINRTDTTIIVNTDNTDLVGKDIDFSLTQINVYNYSNPNEYERNIEEVGSFKDSTTYRDHKILPGENLYFLLGYTASSKEYVNKLTANCEMAPATISINNIFLRGKEITFNGYEITKQKTHPEFGDECMIPHR